MKKLLAGPVLLSVLFVAGCSQDKGLSKRKSAANTTAPVLHKQQLSIVTERRKPVLRNDGNARLTAEDIEAMPTFNMEDLISTRPSPVPPRNGAALQSGGGRSEGQTYIVDGIVLSPGAPATQPAAAQPASAEGNGIVRENGFRSVQASPLSTLSVDVDRAAYSNVRQYLNAGQKPPADAVRIEEMVNYFDYDYPQPAGADPIAIVTELADCPWNGAHKLLHVGLQARRVDTRQLPAPNLVFLVDVSGSMQAPNKLPLVKSSLKLLVDNLRPQDKVAIVVYAGAAGLVLPSTSGADKARILNALDGLEAGGSTAGGAGIELAYKTALEQFVRGGNNRVILATDGDFNVGVSSDNELERLIVSEREKGVFLSVLGYGTGNYQDGKMQLLADKGNGNHAYIDNLQEARKVLVTEFGGTLFTVAKDVKAQIEFNPAQVQAYRLIGYENRLLANEDFRDDKKDAAEMGSGHTVTILYEVIPAGVQSPMVPASDSLRYRRPAGGAFSGELATIRFRYKQPDGAVSREMVRTISTGGTAFAAASTNLRFSASVALFGMLLRNSSYCSGATYDKVIAMAEASRGADPKGYRAGFVQLVRKAR